MKKAEQAYEVIDCHVHVPTGPGEAERIDGWFLKFGEKEFFKRMKDAGVTRMCGTCGWLVAGPAGLDMMRRSNDAALKTRDKYPDFYIPAVQVHPEFAEASSNEIERMYAEGVRWVGEVAWYCMDRQPCLTSEAAVMIFETAQKLGAILNIHCNDIAAIRYLCQRLPKLTIVLAHPRDHRDALKERIDLVAELPNLYLDLSGAGLHRYGMLWYGIQQAGAEKFLFGSDFPICGPAGFLADVLFEPITEKQKQLVLSGNFKRLTGIK